MFGEKTADLHSAVQHRGGTTPETRQSARQDRAARALGVDEVKGEVKE
jgi:hypothetical protein